MNLVVDELQAFILLRIANQMNIPDMASEERCQIALDAIIESLDAQSDVEDEAVAVGQPIDAAAMRAALEQTINPNISTTYTAPTVVEVRKAKENIPFEKLLEMDPQNPVLLQAPDLGDVYKVACEACFSGVSQDLWADHAKMGILVGRVVAAWEEQKGGT